MLGASLVAQLVRAGELEQHVAAQEVQEPGREGVRGAVSSPAMAALFVPDSVLALRWLLSWKGLAWPAAPR